MVVVTGLSLGDVVGAQQCAACEATVDGFYDLLAQRSVGVEHDTASVRSRVEPSGEPAARDLLCHCRHDGEVHATDELRVFPGKRVERTIGQHDGAPCAAWLVAEVGQGLAGGGDHPFPT